MVFVYRVKSMDPICFCNYVFLSWLLYVILYWSLSVLSCWDSFCLLCIKQLSSNNTRVNNILRMLVVWWATSTTNCEICIPCPHMPCPSEYFLSPTGQQVTAVLGHQILLWETAFYYDMADDWSKNQLWNWLIRSSNCLSQYTPLSTWSSLSNFHTLSIFLAIYASEMINPLCNIVLQVFPFSLFLYRNSFVHIDGVNVSKKQGDDFEGSKMISTYFGFLTKSF